MERQFTGSTWAGRLKIKSVGAYTPLVDWTARKKNDEHYVLIKDKHTSTFGDVTKNKNRNSASSYCWPF